MTKTSMKNIILLTLVAFVLILLVSCIIIPRFHKKVTLRGAVPYPIDLGNANERVLCVDDNKDALIWRLRAIEEAKEELILSTYSFVDDESGRDIMAALLNAADRGVNVRIIVDGITSLANLKLSKNFQALSSADNVEVRVYNPVNILKPWKLNYRMHDKYLIADNSVYILGGRNTKNLSLGDYQEKKDIDRDIVVYSHVPSDENSLRQLKNYFGRIWNMSCTKAFPSLNKNTDKAAEKLGERYDMLKTAYPQAFIPTDWESCTIPTRGIRLLHNPIEPENKEPKLWSSIVRLMNSGQESIVQTPYLICNRQMYDDLTNLVKNGKKTEIILNSVETGANVFGSADYLNERKNIMKTGADIYEYSKHHSSHAKTVLIDDNLSLVGSFNFDIRSTYLNTELMLVIDCPELNEHLRSLAQEQKYAGRHFFPDGTVSLGPDYQIHKLSFPRRAAYNLLRVAIWPFRHLF